MGPGEVDVVGEEGGDQGQDEGGEGGQGGDGHCDVMCRNMCLPSARQEHLYHLTGVICQTKIWRSTS